MSFYAIAEGILNQERFSALIALLCLAALFKRDSKSLALFFFAVAYFSTQVPFSFGYAENPGHRFIIQSVASLVMLLLYSRLPSTPYILFAMICELAIMGTNVLAVISEMHQWWQFAAIGIINYLELTSLCLNKWGERDGRKRSTSPGAFGYPLDHVYTRVESRSQKNTRI